VLFRSTTAEGREAVKIIHLRQVEMVGRVMEEFDPADWPRDWVDVSGMSDHILTLPPAAISEFNDKAAELLRDLAARYAGDPAAEKVHVWHGAVPRTPQEDR
jgi:hypothetical protein